MTCNNFEPQEINMLNLKVRISSPTGAPFKIFFIIIHLQTDPKTCLEPQFFKQRVLPRTCNVFTIFCEHELSRTGYLYGYKYL